MFIRLRLAFARAALRLAQPMTGLQLIDQREPEDVYVVGFPKSGHTWMQYLLAGLVGGLDVARGSDTLVQDLVPDVQYRLAYRRYTRPVFFKSHAMPRPDYRRVIYLLRDGRDAMVSYWHYHNALFPPVDLATLVRDAPHLEARWHEHVESWLANPDHADLLVVRYEQLRADPVAELQRVADFAGIATDVETLGRVVAAADFEQQKKREKQRGWDNARWPKDKAFIRRGAVGSFRDEMSPEALALFQAEAGPTLARHGYGD